MSVRQPQLCAADFPAKQGDEVQWQNPTLDCIVSQDGNNTFPFASIPPGNPANSININPSIPPAPQVMVVVPPSTTPYSYQISCCPQQNPVHTVTVSDGAVGRKKSKRRK